MKRIAVIALALCLAALLSSCIDVRYKCAACGRKTDKLYECPVCYSRVCESCADPFYYFDRGEMQEYLEKQGYLVFADWNEASEAMIDVGVFDEVAADLGYILEG